MINDYLLQDAQSFAIRQVPCGRGGSPQQFIRHRPCFGSFPLIIAAVPSAQPYKSRERPLLATSDVSLSSHFIICRSPSSHRAHGTPPQRSLSKQKMALARAKELARPFAQGPKDLFRAWRSLRGTAEMKGSPPPLPAVRELALTAARRAPATGLQSRNRLNASGDCIDRRDSVRNPVPRPAPPLTLWSREDVLRKILVDADTPKVALLGTLFWTPILGYFIPFIALFGAPRLLPLCFQARVTPTNSRNACLLHVEWLLHEHTEATEHGAPSADFPSPWEPRMRYSDAQHVAASDVCKELVQSSKSGEFGVSAGSRSNAPHTTSPAMDSLMRIPGHWNLESLSKTHLHSLARFWNVPAAAFPLSVAPRGMLVRGLQSVADALAADDALLSAGWFAELSAKHVSQQTGDELALAAALSRRGLTRLGAQRLVALTIKAGVDVVGNSSLRPGTRSEESDVLRDALKSWLHGTSSSGSNWELVMLHVGPVLSEP